MRGPVLPWQLSAVLSATFAALTAIFAKVGVENINSDFATLVRTVVILLVLVISTGQWHPVGDISARTYTFLTLSGLATGASWLCYFRALQLGDAARVAPIDKLSVVLVALFGASFLGERVSGLNWFGVVLIGGGTILIAYRG